MELLAGSFAGNEFISILIFCCDARDKLINDATRKKVIFLNMVQSKSFLMRSEQDFTQRSKGNKALGNLCVFAPWFFA
jgi:hypothetical protein